MAPVIARSDATKQSRSLRKGRRQSWIASLARNDKVFSQRGRVRALLTTAQQQSFAFPRLLALLPGRVGLARRARRGGGVRLAHRLPAGLAANVLLLPRTAGPPGFVGPLPVALARLPTLDRLPLPGRVRGRKP